MLRYLNTPGEASLPLPLGTCTHAWLPAAQTSTPSLLPLTKQGLLSAFSFHPPRGHG